MTSFLLEYEFYDNSLIIPYSALTFMSVRRPNILLLFTLCMKFI